MNILNLLRLSTCFLTLFCTSATLFADNPIISHKYTADPSALVYKDRVYVYMSNDEDNNEGYQIYNYTLISSDDLVNWTDHGEVFKVKDISKWAGMAYAPSCIVRNDKFYLYYPDGGTGIGVAVADKPEGPFTDPLGKALLNKQMPNCNVPWLFDPCGFIDDDGEGYLYFGGGDTQTGVNLRVIKLNSDLISTSGNAITINAPASFEASYMHKYNNTYYFSYATTGASKIDYLTSSKPMSDFTHKGTVLPNPPKDMNNNNHSSIMKYKDTWYIFYHDRSVSNAVYKRSVCVDILTYNADGTMKQTVCTTPGVAQVKNLNPFDTVQAETIDKQKGIETSPCSEGGIMLSSIASGDFTSLSGVDFKDGATRFEVRAASGTEGGTIELHLGSETGTLVGTCAIISTAGWTTWKTFSCEVTGCSGVKNLYLVYKGSGEPFRLNWFRFTGSTTAITYKNTPVTISGAPRRTSLAGCNSHVPHTAGSMLDLSGRVLSKNQSSQATKTRTSTGIVVQRKVDRK